MPSPAYLYLSVAIIAEVIATSALKVSDGLTHLLPSIVSITGYTIAFWCMSLALRDIPTGIAYAIWSGIGIVLITAFAWVWFKQVLDAPALVGMALIIAGVVVINVFSSSAGS